MGYTLSKTDYYHTSCNGKTLNEVLTPAGEREKESLPFNSSAEIEILLPLRQGNVAVVEKEI